MNTALLYDFDSPGDLVGGQALGAMVEHRIGFATTAGGDAHNDVRGAGGVVFDVSLRGLHVRHALQTAFDFPQRHPSAVDLDDIVLAVAEVKALLSVEVAHVACAQPALEQSAPDRNLVPAHGQGRQERGGYARAAHPDGPNRPHRQPCAVAARNADFDAGQGGTHTFWRGSIEIDGYGTGFATVVTGKHGHAIAFVARARYRDGQGYARGDQSRAALAQRLGVGDPREQGEVARRGRVKIDGLVDERLGQARPCGSIVEVQGRAVGKRGQSSEIETL